MTPDDPRHGTMRGYSAHTHDKTLPPCEPCNAARREHVRRNHRLKAYGRFDYWGDLDAVRDHIRSLMAAGFSARAIADHAGVLERTIRNIPNGTTQQIQKGTASRILAVKRDTNPPTVPAYRLVRRVQALCAIGHTTRYIASRLGVGQVTVWRWYDHGVYVRTDLAEAMIALYDELHMIPGPSARTRARAAAKGWLPPLAYDDIDDPTERPSRGAPTRHNSDDHIDEAAVERRMAGDRSVTLTKAERAEVVARLKERGESASVIEKRHGLNARRDIA